MPTTQIAIRLDHALLARLDAYRAQMAADMPGLAFSRADAIRVVLERGLAVAARPGRLPLGRASRSRKR